MMGLPYGFPNRVLVNTWYRAYIAGAVDQTEHTRRILNGPGAALFQAVEKIRREM